jgi:hypothetical protein
MARLFFDLAILCCIPIAPWWVPFCLALLGLMLFRHYGEGIAIFFLYDLAFGLPGGGWLHSQFSFTVVIILAYVLVESYKDRLRFYR